jgi:hypothetical protein
MLARSTRSHRSSRPSRCAKAILRVASALVLTGALAGPIAACGGDDATAGDAPATEVVEWNRMASELVAREPQPVQVRNMAMVQIAVHDALNAIEPRYEAYEYKASAPGASVAAAVAAATRDTLARLLPAAVPTLDAAYATRLATIADGAAKDSGIAAGRAAAAAILARRSADDLPAAIGKPYTVQSAAPGVYRLTPPPTNFVIGAGIGELTPFALHSPGAFRSPAPFATGSDAYRADYDEVKTLGSAASTQRTPQQTETARFWYDAATKEWHSAARKGLADNAADEWQAARVLALVGIAMFDSAVASLETKFHANYWRPVTAIRAGDTDGNDATQGDATWLPLCVTPPFPEHNSTHAATGAAAAGVLALTLGNRHVFTVDSPTLAGVSRTYQRFSDAAEEEGLSRIYCGIHFRNGMNTGLAQGDQVAGFVVAGFLRRAGR